MYYHIILIKLLYYQVANNHNGFILINLNIFINLGSIHYLKL